MGDEKGGSDMCCKIRSIFPLLRLYLHHSGLLLNNRYDMIYDVEKMKHSV